MAERFLGIYDGDCGVCSRFVEYAQASARRASVGFAPFAGISDAALAQYGLTVEACASAFQLVDTQQHVVVASGAAAIRKTLTLQRHRFAWVARAVDFIPGMNWLERRVYSMIAARRARLSGMLGLHVCKVHSANAGGGVNTRN